MGIWCVAYKKDSLHYIIPWQPFSSTYSRFLHSVSWCLIKTLQCIGFFPSSNFFLLHCIWLLRNNNLYNKSTIQKNRYRFDRYFISLFCLFFFQETRTKSRSNNHELNLISSIDWIFYWPIVLNVFVLFFQFIEMTKKLIYICNAEEC